MKYKELFDFMRNGGYKDSFILYTKNGDSIPFSKIKVAEKKEVVKFEQEYNVCKVYVNASIADIADENTKFYWYVTNSADDESTGYVLLTKKEAELIAFATNMDNWEEGKISQCGGFFTIDMNRPVTVEDFEKGVR